MGEHDADTTPAIPTARAGAAVTVAAATSLAGGLVGSPTALADTDPGPDAEAGHHHRHDATTLADACRWSDDVDSSASSDDDADTDAADLPGFDAGYTDGCSDAPATRPDTTRVDTTQADTTQAARASTPRAEPATGPALHGIDVPPPAGQVRTIKLAGRR